MKNKRNKKKIFPSWRKHLIHAAITCSVLCFFAMSVASAAVSPKTLIVDDFTDTLAVPDPDPNSEINSMKYWTGGGVADAEGNGGLVVDEDVENPEICGDYPVCHQITYTDGNPETPDVDEGLYQWWASCLWDGLHPDTKTNLLRYTHIAFEVKGEVGGEDFYIGLQESNKKKHDQNPWIKASDFIQDSEISTEWETVRIPLNKFIKDVVVNQGQPDEYTIPGVNLNVIQAIDFMFYVPGSLSGTIYFTNLRFEGAKIDDFEDSVSGENLLRHPYSTGEGRMEPGCGDVDDEKIAGNRCHKLVWDISKPTEPGYWYTVTWFDEWNSDEATDISLYDTLNIRVKSEAGGGGEAFRIEFQEAFEGGSVELREVSSSTYVTLTEDWQLLSIPLADFGATNKNNMKALALLFGKGDDTPAGTIYIDDVYLAYENQTPIIGGNGLKTFYVDYLNSFRIPGSDPEDDHLVYSTHNLPQGAQLDPRNGLIVWKPTSQQKKTHGGIVLEANDGMYTAQKTISIEVVDFPGFEKDQSEGRIKVDKVNKKLFVDGKEFKIKGMGYHPVPIGLDPDPASWEITEAIAKRDFPVLREMRINTIRTWNNVNDVLLDYAKNYGMKVCATFWVEPSSDFTDDLVRSGIIENFKTYVIQYKNHPAVLMWVLGNDVDFHNEGDIPNLIAWYSLANEMAKAAYEIEGANYHPVAIANTSLRRIGNVDLGTDDATLNYVDMWGMYCYTGYSFEYPNFIMEHILANNYFADYSTVSDKAMWILEYGIDSFITTSYDVNGDPTGGVSDEATHSVWLVHSTEEMLGSLGESVCVGGAIMAYTDEWWKAGDPNNHDNPSDLGGYSTLGMGNDVHPDDYANEEYWGIFAVADDGANPDILIKKQKTIDETTYCAYDDLRDQCFNIAPVITSPTVNEVTFYVGENDGFFIIAHDDNGDKLVLDYNTDPPIPSDTLHDLLFQFANTNFARFSLTPTAGDVGDYTVTFVAIEDWTIYDPDGVKGANIQITIHVVDPGADAEAPVADAGGNITVFEDTPIIFDGSASYDLPANVGGIMNYQWDFSYDGVSFNNDADGPVVVLEPTNPLYGTSFAGPGDYTVALQVNDGAGNGPVIATLTVTVIELVNRVNVPYSVPSEIVDNKIQWAVNVALSGDEVYVWSGEYTEDIVMKNGVSLVGEDVLNCIIKGNILFKEVDGSVEKFTIEYPDGSLVNLQNGVYPDPGLDLLTDAGVTLINSNAEIKSCIILPDDTQPQYYGKGIQVWNMYNSLEITPNIENNLILNADVGIFLFSQSFGEAIKGFIQNNTLDENNYGIVERMHKENPIIRNNIISNSSDGIHFTYWDGVLLPERLDNVINNNFWDNDNAVWCDEAETWQTPTGPGNIAVDPFYSLPPDDYTPQHEDCNVPDSEMGARL